MSEQSLSVAEAAGKLNVSPRTIQRYCKEGRLDHTWIMGKRHKELRVISPISLSQLPGGRRKNLAGSFDYISRSEHEAAVTGFREDIRRLNLRMAVLEQDLAALRAGGSLPSTAMGTGTSSHEGILDHIAAFVAEQERIRPAERQLILKLAAEVRAIQTRLAEGDVPVRAAGND